MNFGGESGYTDNSKQMLPTFFLFFSLFSLNQRAPVDDRGPLACCLVGVALGPGQILTPEVLAHGLLQQGDDEPAGAQLPSYGISRASLSSWA